MNAALSVSIIMAHPVVLDVVRNITLLDYPSHELRLILDVLNLHLEFVSGRCHRYATKEPKCIGRIV